MTEHYLYLDETGTLDFEDRPGERFFGVGTAHFVGDHRDAIWDGHRLRLELESKGIYLPKGLHAKNDASATRAEVYTLIGDQSPRLSATMLLKSAAYGDVRLGGKIRLYQMAIWLHLKFEVRQASSPGDRVFVIVGSLQTSTKREAIRDAVKDVCNQLGYDREIVPCIWDAPSSWGIQVADYGLWATQRKVEGKKIPGYLAAIEPHLRSAFCPWGK